VYADCEVGVCDSVKAPANKVGLTSRIIGSVEGARDTEIRGTNHAEEIQGPGPVVRV
jgi:hypothetical protein